MRPTRDSSSAPQWDNFREGVLAGIAEVNVTHEPPTVLMKEPVVVAVKDAKSRISVKGDAARKKSQEEFNAGCSAFLKKKCVARARTDNIAHESVLAKFAGKK